VVVWLGSDAAVVVVVVGPIIVVMVIHVELAEVVCLDHSRAFGPVVSQECALPCGCPFLLVFYLKQEINLFMPIISS